ncbi:MAG: hybrid sensor histidine kinase/response regulator [Bacteroidales bacterium]
MKSKIDYISEHGGITLKEIRIGLLVGLLIYSLFGILDPFMASSHYTIFWTIRFAMVCPVILFAYLMTCINAFKHLTKIMSMVALFIAELSILAMIFIADNTEPASLGYYAGLILIILWSGFVFRFSLQESLFYLISSVLLYNLIFFFTHDISATDKSESLYWLIGNNFFLVSTGIIAIIGNHSIRKFTEDIQNKNRALHEGQKALTNAKIRAEESDMLKSAFLSNLSHEIRTPMNGIIGFSEMLKDKETTRDEISEYADIVVKSSSKLLHLINNMLDLSMLQTGQVKLHFQNLNVHESLVHVANKYKPQAEEKGLILNLIMDKDSELFLTTDHMRLRHILGHLLENAIKFTHIGYIKMGYINKNDTVLFYVQDTGIGIEKEYQDIIFEHFRQIEASHTRSYGGSGLGLAIAKNMTHLLNGEIFIESMNPNGTCFFVSLPKTKSKTGSQASNKNVLMPARRIKILIAEDDDSCRQYMSAVLKHKNIELIMAKNGHEAIDKFKSNADTDLIFADYKMPDINGDQIMKTIKKINNKVPVIAQTGFTSAEDKIKMFECGFDGFLPKPIKSNDLISIIKQHVPDSCHAGMF